MGLEQNEDFLWTFPLYVLACNVTYGRTPNSFLLDERIRFAAPERGPGEPCLALFTDEDLAERHRQTLPDQWSMKAFPLMPEHALELLKVAQAAFPRLVIDPNTETRIARYVDTAELVSGLESRLRG